MSRILRTLLALSMAGMVLVSAACGGPATAPTAAPTKAPVVGFPTKDIRLIVPFKPGGGYDIQARIIAPYLEKYLPSKVNVIIDNVSAANGKVGNEEVSKAKPDGYTIAFVGREGVAFMAVNGEMEVDPLTWTWLGEVSSDPRMIVIPTAGKFKTVASMKGQDVRVGATAETLPSVLVLGQGVGIKVRPVLFPSSAEAMLGAQRGDVDMASFAYTSVIKPVQDSQGKLTAIAAVADKRIAEFPDVPTLGELGMPLGVAAASVAFGTRAFVAPPNMDKALAGVWETAIAKAMKDPDFLAQMVKASQAPAYKDAAATQAGVKAAVDAFKSVYDVLKPLLQQ